MNNYIKVIPNHPDDKHLICYVCRELASQLEHATGAYNLYRLSDFIIDKKSNKFIKCRYDLEFLLDNFDPPVITS